MRVAVEEIEGVREASVSLDEGRVTVALTDGNRMTMAHLREVIRDRGFTPREAELRVRGTAVRDGMEWSFRVGGSNEVFLLSGTPDALQELVRREGEELVAIAHQADGNVATLRIESVVR